MGRDSVFRTEKGRRAVEAVYREAIEYLAVDFEDRWVETRHGRTEDHRIVAPDTIGQPGLSDATELTGRIVADETNFLHSRKATRTSSARPGIPERPPPCRG